LKVAVNTVIGTLALFMSGLLRLVGYTAKGCGVSSLYQV